MIDKIYVFVDNGFTETQGKHMKMNTYITFLYKTASSIDTKLIPLEGEFSAPLFDRLIAALNKGDIDSMFIPYELGLDSPADGVISEFGYDDEIDFAGVLIQELHYADNDFGRFKSSVEVCDNQDVVTKFTVEGFVSMLESVPFDINAELNRLQSL